MIYSHGWVDLRAQWKPKLVLPQKLSASTGLTLDIEIQF